MYKIISDGDCDLFDWQLKENDVDIVPFYVSLDGKTYQKEKVDVDVRDFYQYCVDHPGVFPKSSMPNVGDYVECFKKYLEKGYDIICLVITTKFSGSYNSAMSAKEILEPDYPDLRITVIDTNVNTVLQGLLVLETARMQQAGYSYDEVINRVNEIKPTGRIIFTIGDFSYLTAGGRIGKVAGAFVNFLGVRPLIVLKEGEIFPFGVARGRKKSIESVKKEVCKHIDTNHIDLDDYAFSIGYGYDKHEAEVFRDEMVKLLEERYNKHVDFVMDQIGATIAVHTGPYPIGVTLLEKTIK